MQDHHASFLQIFVGTIGMITSWFITHDIAMHNLIAAFSFYGSAFLVFGGLINYFTGWSFIKWIKNRKKKK